MRTSAGHDGDVAVCLIGQSRSIHLTAASIRQYVLEKWIADAYVIASVTGMRQPVSEIRASIDRLGPRVAKVIIGDDSTLLGITALQHVLNAPAMRTFMLQQHLRPFAADLLNRRQCAPIVFDAARRRGRAYSCYIRMRLDIRLFEPLPAAFVRGLLPDEAVIPTGEQYGQWINASYTDRFIACGAAAFAADSALWRSVVNGGDHPTETLVNQAQWNMDQVGRHTLERHNGTWIMETLIKAHLTGWRVQVSLEPLAHCILRDDGSCKYLGELALARGRVPGLLRSQPRLCGNFGRAARCEAERPVLAPIESQLVEGERFCKLYGECKLARMQS